MTKKPVSLFDYAIVTGALGAAVRKLDPRHMARNPVMFIVEAGSVIVTVLFFKELGSSSTQENLFAGLIALWLWFTVLFANFAEAMAEGAARRRPTRCAGRARRRSRGDAASRRHDRGGAERAARRRRRRRRLHGSGDPGRRRRDRGHRLGRRVGDHRRVGARDPRVGRRPLGRDRRHACALGRDRRARHSRSRARASSTA